jgi:hypothetical protein
MNVRHAYGWRQSLSDPLNILMSMAMTVRNATELLWQQLIHVPNEQT